MMPRKRSIEIAWNIDDLDTVILDMDDDTDEVDRLTDDQKYEILKKVESEHDAAVGINWQVLENAVRAYCLEQKEKTISELGLPLFPSEGLVSHLASSHGIVSFTEDGTVIDCELDPDGFGLRPVWINVYEWQKRYPDEDFRGKTHDILDFGYVDSAGDYCEPEESWRSDRRKARSDDL